MGWNGGYRNGIWGILVGICGILVGICGVWGELLYLKGCAKFKRFEINKGLHQYKIIPVIF